MSEARGVVIVGAGLMGRWHAQVIRALGERLVSVVDADGKRAGALASRYGARPTTVLHEALQHRPRAVHVCTPPESHVAIASEVLAAGAHALIEKPFAASATATATILKTAEEQRRIACPVHQFLFQRGVQEAFAARHAFGPLLHFDFVACSAGTERSGSGDAGRRRLALDILPHPLSLLRRLVETLSSVTWHAISPSAGEVRITGASGEMSISILISSRGRPTRNSVRIIGEHGTAHVDLFHGFATFESSRVSRAHKIARPFRLATSMFIAASANLSRRLVNREFAYPGLRELVRAFYVAIQSGGPPPITPQETTDVSATVDHLAAFLREA